ncbi:MAG: hypothetical protein KZQ58_05035 [gamma proteobacterium symbiont of Bathyaustriella thionipta]|nr:hypothetical protein [gamma proteobacterium symbiont of Bathyaustriella thionipta]
MHAKKTLSGLLAIWLLLAGSWACAQTAGRLIYRIRSGTEPASIQRILITHNHVRLDDGIAADGYVLYDREKRYIYNINHEDKSILLLNPESTEVKQRKVLQRLTLARDPDAPQVAAVETLHEQYVLNGKVCENVMLAHGLLPELRSALIEYYQRMADQEALVAEITPTDLQQDCDLALFRDQPAMAFTHGLPLMIWKANGFQQKLLDFSASTEVEANLFTLPDGYTKINFPAPADKNHKL